MFAYCLQKHDNCSVSVRLQARASRRPTWGHPSCRSSWRRCSVCCSQCVQPPHTCRSSTSPSSCRWSTAPSSTAATRPSSAWREYGILMRFGFARHLSSSQMDVKRRYHLFLNQTGICWLYCPGFPPLPSVCACSFPSCHFGKLYGMVLALSAIFAVLQYPCFALVKGALGGDPLYVSKTTPTTPFLQSSPVSSPLLSCL